MRTFFGVCLLVIGGWVLTLLDMLLFFDILAEIRGMLFGILGLASLVLVALGVLAMKVRRYYVLGMTLLLSSLVMWATVLGFSMVDSHPHWSRYLPTDFTESFSNLSSVFTWLFLKTLVGFGLVWHYRKT
ncbi:hypothetical protein [Neisseria weixii]|uniref:hypothetical protein n=1 Tax=Neisseria weixii TaxID=1853276 RepID=UPI00359F5E6F